MFLLWKSNDSETSRRSTIRAIWAECSGDRLQTIGRKSLQAGYEEIVADVRKSAPVNLDEIGWVQNKNRAWRWVAVGPNASLFVFAAHDGVSPTNNIAEQTIRKAVIFRKLSFSTEEQTGSLNLSVIFSAVETCRRQGLSAIAWIREAMANLFAGKTSPGLLPAEQDSCERLPRNSMNSPQR